MLSGSGIEMTVDFERLTSNENRKRTAVCTLAGDRRRWLSVD